MTHHELEFYEYDKYDCGAKVCDDCADGRAAIPLTIYLFFNIGYNIVTMLLLKEGSASFFFLINAVKLPITTFLFSSELVMGA